MSDLDIFKEDFLPNIETFNKLSYRTWKASNPGEAGRWEPYRDQILAGNSPPAPMMVTRFGKALVAAAELVSATPEPLPANVALSAPTGQVS